MPSVLRRVHRLLSLIVAATTLPLRIAQAAAPPDDVSAAFVEQRWPDAIRLLQAALADRPSDALAELRLGVALTHTRQFGAARQHLDRAEQLGAPKAALAYRRASLYAQTGDRDAAFAQLDLALAQGIGAPMQPESDTLLDPLRGDARFASFLDRFEKSADPCNHDPHYREFDFWVGRWDVRQSGAAPDGPASENIITLEHNGCVVQEHWRSIAGSTGSSFNIYDASRGMWFQTWVDSTGGLHEYRGRPDAQGNMRLVGETPGNPDQPARVPTRLTLFRVDANHVRQFSESSVDGGKTWTTNYDLQYTRRNDAMASASPAMGASAAAH